MEKGKRAIKTAQAVDRWMRAALRLSRSAAARGLSPQSKRTGGERKEGHQNRTSSGQVDAGRAATQSLSSSPGSIATVETDRWRKGRGLSKPRKQWIG